MKILHVITRLILGGAQQNTVMSCAAQAAAGHDVHLAYGPIHGPEGSLLEEAKASGATLHEIPTMVRQLSPLKDWRCYRDLRKLVRDLRPDLVHSHSSKAGILTRCAAWKERVSLAEISESDGRLSVVERGASPHIVHTVHGLPFNHYQPSYIRRAYIALEWHAARRCDHLIAITSAMARIFEYHRIAPQERFTVIPSGIDIDQFDIDLPRRDAKQLIGLDPTKPVVGMVARLDALKGHRHLFAALPKLTREIPGVQVLLVGDGPDRELVLKQLEASPHRDCVRMLDLVPWTRMPEIYRAIDVCVLPSDQEGQSRVLVEALAAGCAIVGNDVGGIPEVCLDGKTGLSSGYGGGLAGATTALLKKHELRERLITTGKQHIRDNFSAEKMNRDLLELYDRAVNPINADMQPPAP